MNRAALLLALSLGLAACEQQSAAPAEQGGQATGQILEGSVSDAMIPLDELKSEAPLAPRRNPVDSTDGLDGEQPEVEPVEGVEGAPAEPAAATAAAVPAPTE